jgi:chromosome segregation ATPase
MKLKIVIGILAVACIGLLIGLLAVKKQGEEQHATDASSIADFSNQVASADLKINDLNNANLTYSNDFALSQQHAAQLSNSLAAAQVTIAESQTTIANAQQQITNLNSRIGDLEVQNKVLDEQASELTNTIAKLDSLIADTQNKLGLSESNSVYLQQELQKQMAQKAEIEHKFNDVDELRHQVRKIKDDLFVARRLQLMKNDNGQKKGAQLLIQRNVPVTNNPAAPNYGLNVEAGSDGSVRVIPPLGAPTNAPAH